MLTRESLLRDIGRLFVWYPLRFASAILPLAVSRRVFRFMGSLHCLAAGQKRKHLAANLQRLFPDAPGPAKKACLARFFHTHYASQLFIFQLPKLQARKKLQQQVAGAACLKALQELDRDRGTIILHGHMHVPQLALYYLFRHNLPVAQIGHVNEKNLSFVGRVVQLRLRKKLESKLACHIFPAEHFMRGPFRWLQQGNMLFIAADGAGPGRTFGRARRLPFLSGSYQFPSGYLKLAEKTGARLIWLQLEEKDRCLHISCRPLPVSGGDETLQDIARLLENNVRRAPCAWHYLDSPDTAFMSV